MKSKDVCLDIFGFRQCGKIFLYPPVINAEELVCPGSHVDVIRLALCPFLVHESIDGIISRRTLDYTYDDLEAVSRYMRKINNLGVGCELSSFTDIFWNTESLCRVLKGKRVEKTIAMAIAEFEQLNNGTECCTEY